MGRLYWGLCGELLRVQVQVEVQGGSGLVGSRWWGDGWW